jgi:hypothetical protein
MALIRNDVKIAQSEMTVNYTGDLMQVILNRYCQPWHPSYERTPAGPLSNGLKGVIFPLRSVIFPRLLNKHDRMAPPK